MRRLLYTLVLMLLLSGCKHGDNIELWNDLKVGDDVYHFTLVEFRGENQIACTGDRDGYLLLGLTLADGTIVTRKHLLQCAEGYRSEYAIPPGELRATLHGSDNHDGDYHAIAGHVVVERHEFKAIIELSDLRLVRQGGATDTIGIDDGYLSFDLSLF